MSSGAMQSPASTLSSYYPIRVCAAGLCVWSHRFVYVCICVCVCVCVCVCGQKIDLFSVLLFEKFLLCVLYYLILEFKRGFLHPASCTDGAICVFYLRPALEYGITVCHALLYTIATLHV